MTRERAIDESLAGAVERLACGDHDAAITQAHRGLERAPDAPDLLRIVLRAQLALGHHDAARGIADRLAALPGQPGAVEQIVEAALDSGALRDARSAVSAAEAEGMHGPAQIAQLKARIALATGDLLAAKAILVSAIETAPENAALRALLTEAMVAAGTASDARAVLGHLGQPPGSPAAARAPDVQVCDADGRSGDVRELPGSKAG